tara:strand:- start:18914 stop:20515 length:1602 start_codon:yes stop_codon:yes gene_type:complete
MEKFDVIIVGAGASGIPAGWSLSNSGYKVVIFEQGNDFDLQSLIPIEEGGELQKFKDLNPNPNVRKSFGDYNVDCSDSPIDIANFNGVGGSTVLFSGQYPRLHRDDFNVFSNDRVAVDWPINYSDLKPFYELNDFHTGLSGIAGDPYYPDVEPNMPPVPLGEMGRRLVEGFKKLDWEWWPSYSALNTERYQGRPKDDFLRPSNMVDCNRSKGSTNNTYLEKAISNGLIIKKKSQVIRLIPDKLGKKINCIYSKDEFGNVSKSFGKVIIIAASGIGTPRLLLGSKSTLFTRGICNTSDQVGRNLMLHPLGYVEGLFDSNLYSNVGPQGCCLLSQEFYNSNPKRGFKRGYTFQAIRGPLPIEAAVNFLTRKDIKLGKDFVKEFLLRYNRTAHLAVITEDLPDKNNRVLLINNDKNNTLPDVKIKYKVSSNTQKMLNHGLSNGRKLLKISGASKTFAFGPVRYTGWHILGTCRMGNDPNKSVVNKYGKTHDFENLFIVDGSIFPTSGGVNPASTIQALSLYIANAIKSRYKDIFKY